jgi:putative phosphoesterase
MRVAALYDIHANLPALEAVLRALGREEVDRIVVGGDVLPGPMPRETLACLGSLKVPVEFIRGNGEAAVLAQRAGALSDRIPEHAREAIRWTAQQLDRKHERLISTWPQTACVEVDGLGPVVFCHATPRSDTEIFTRLTPENQLRPMFAEIDARVVVCGHTHMQFDRMVGDVRVLNAGSVGMPFGAAGAYWLLLGPDVQLRHTPYDLTAAAERIRATNYPQAMEFATRNVLEPPSEREMLELFIRASTSSGRTI